MKKSDLIFTEEDIKEIFGEKILTDEKKIEKEVKEELKEISKSIIIKSKFKEIEPLEKTASEKFEEKSEDEIKKQNVELTFSDFLNETIILQILEFNEEIRKIVENELLKILPQKPVYNMFLRTLEKCANNFILLKNTNFSIDGKIKENGSIDSGRLLQNIQKYKTQIREVDKEIENTLKTLFNMRMNAIKIGLKSEIYEKIKERIKEKLNILKVAYKFPIYNFFKNKILNES